jgi:tripartite-type tricarboxylate transporter receptor subunit TctC
VQTFIKKCIVSTLTAIMVVALAATAQSAYPEKHITIYFGYKTGGSCYVSLQALCQEAEKILGQALVLVEKSGASATIAGGATAKAKPDGYTLGCIKSTTITSAPYEYKLPYSPSEDLTHLYAYAGPPSGFAVRADYPRKTWQEFIDYAKANPGKVCWAATGTMGTQYLIMKYIGKQEGIQWNGVPCSGGAEAMKLVLGGQVDGYAASGSHIQHIRAGRAMELFDFSKKSDFPGVPTLEELGYQGLTVNAEPYIVIAPKGLPDNILKTLENAFSQASQAPGYLAVVQRMDMQPVNLKGEELEKMLHENDKLIAKLLEGKKKK